MGKMKQLLLLFLACLTGAITIQAQKAQPLKKVAIELKMPKTPRG
jgi:hypothetical protein